MNKNKLLLLIFLLGFPSSTWADEYITEDGETLEYEHMEADLYSAVMRTRDGNTFQAPAVEMDVGLLPDVQGRLILPIALASLKGQSTAYGYGDMQAGLKVRFIHETETIPQISFFPVVTLPIGSAASGLGNGGAIEALPLWFLKKWGDWSLSGGGGYSLNQGPQNVNYGFGGALLQWKILKNLTLGGELYAQGTSNPTSRSTFIFNGGGTYNFTPNISFLLSAGHSIAGQKTLIGYVGLGFTWGPL